MLISKWGDLGTSVMGGITKESLSPDGGAFPLIAQAMFGMTVTFFLFEDSLLMLISRWGNALMNGTVWY